MFDIEEKLKKLNIKESNIQINLAIEIKEEKIKILKFKIFRDNIYIFNNISIKVYEPFSLKEIATLNYGYEFNFSETYSRQLQEQQYFFDLTSNNIK